MAALRLDRLLELLSSSQVLVGLLWAGLAAFTVALVVLMQTRWGQSRPLRKCVALSFLAHMLLAGYATTVHIVGEAVVPEERVFHVSFVEGSAQGSTSSPAVPKEQEPWERFVPESVIQPPLDEPEPQKPAPPLEPQREPAAPAPPEAEQPPLEHLALGEVAPPEPQMPPPPEPAPPAGPRAEAEPIEVPEAQRREAVLPALPGAEAPELKVPDRPAEPPPEHPPSAGLPHVLKDNPGPLPQLSDNLPIIADAAPASIGSADRLLPVPPRQPAPPIFGQGSTPRFGGGLVPVEQPDASGGEGRLHRPVAGELATNLPAGMAGLGSGTAWQGMVGPPRLPTRPSEGPPGTLPSLYQLRTAPNRAQLAQQRGATTETEAAVQAALRWLAANQSPDGRWDASLYGAGRELRVAGHDRQHAGLEADTGMTGLALLAFLAAGHTHQQGDYQETVRGGLEFLLRSQQKSGDLAGQARTFARMYCHAMAFFALSEAYGMTRDQRLQEPLRRAAAYTLSAQHPQTGGWRYWAGDPGDTSQLGWQLMALKSAELAGIPIPANARQGMIRYLRSVSAGSHGGLASYRPGEKVSRPMTAEALVCWQFLGLDREHPACAEAADYLVQELPGQGQPNFYYWYYATLGLYQLQGPAWQRWNQALRSTLLASQRKDGSLSGSWDPTTVWGGYGGRVYTTALATLCLEVYYRYLPLYDQVVAPAR